MILHALELAARDFLVGLGVCVAFDLAAAGWVYLEYRLERRNRRRFVRLEEARAERERRDYRARERRRCEMRCYGNARPTAGERWDRRAA